MMSFRTFFDMPDALAIAPIDETVHCAAFYSALAIRGGPQRPSTTTWMLEVRRVARSCQHCNEASFTTRPGRVDCLTRAEARAAE